LEVLKQNSASTPAAPAGIRRRPGPRWSFRRLFWNVAALLAAGVLVYIAYLSIRIEQQSTRDEARPAEIIIVLGAAEYYGRPSPVLKARLDHALTLWQKKFAPHIMTTGGAGGDPFFTEGGVGRAYLISRGVPSEAIVVETEGESTAHSMAAAGEIMHRMGLRSCIVVSDGYHIYRVKKMLQFRGLDVYGSPRPWNPRGSVGERWLYFRQAIAYFLWAIGVRV
jgi:uncharacterized SAM-binding protein YcdF (DUF218 family)